MVLSEENALAELKGDFEKSVKYLEQYFNTPLQDGVQNEIKNDLTEIFYKSMVDYAVDRRESTGFQYSANGETSLEKTNLTADCRIDRRNVRMAFGSGNVYEGCVATDLVPRGKGRLFLNIGVTYEGDIKDGLPEGRGIIRWADGSWYEGEFRDGLRNGRGLHVSSEDGRRWYSGPWTGGLREGPEGQTSCESDNAMDYVGHWVDGRPHGHGTATWPDGTRYAGQWADGKPHGHGKIVWPDNDVYEGDWADGFMDRTGTYEWSSNPSDCDQLVLSLCDRYTGQWSKSKKHGPGVFRSAESGATVRGHWVDDALDGPCDIILSNGRRPPNSARLVFRQNVLYELTQPPLSTPPPQKLTGIGRCRCHRSKIPVATPEAHRDGLQPPSTATATTTAESTFRLPCEPQLETIVVENDVVAAKNLVQKTGSGDGGRARPEPKPTRASVRLVADDTSYDLTGHVCRLAAKCAATVTFSVTTGCRTVAVDVATEMLAAECALHKHLRRIRHLYQAYGSAFVFRPPAASRPSTAAATSGPSTAIATSRPSTTATSWPSNIATSCPSTTAASCPSTTITYRTLMTRLGLWQMLVDYNLHAKVPLADFDDTLYENDDYLFDSAHDPFEPIYFWQFVHAVCELASVVYDTREVQEDARRTGVMASALNKLFAEHMKTNVVVPTSYADVCGGERWADSRKTLTRMYEVFRTTTGGDGLPSALRLIRSYGPKLRGGDGGDGEAPPAELSSALPAILDVVIGLRDEQTAEVESTITTADYSAAAARSRLTVFKCTVGSVTALLAEACPRILADPDRRDLLTAVETRLVFADWYRFVLLCFRDCRKVASSEEEDYRRYSAVSAEEDYHRSSAVPAEEDYGRSSAVSAK